MIQRPRKPFGEAARFAVAALILGFALHPSMTASPINVSYTTTGSPEDWTLNFSVNNNLIGFPGQFLLLFGVLSDSTVVTGSATDFTPDGAYDPINIGGSRHKLQRCMAWQRV
jgi:hypothetical protein